MKVPDDLPYDVPVRDDRLDVRKYPFVWTVVILSPLCALFWMVVIWGLMAWLGG